MTLIRCGDDSKMEDNKDMLFDSCCGGVACGSLWGSPPVDERKPLDVGTMVAP